MVSSLSKKKKFLNLLKKVSFQSWNFWRKSLVENLDMKARKFGLGRSNFMKHFGPNIYGDLKYD